MFSKSKNALFVAFMILVVFTLGIFSVNAANTDDETSGTAYSFDDLTSTEYQMNDFKYITLDENSVMITQYVGKQKEIEVPEKIDNKDVSLIYYRAFINYSNVTLKGYSKSIAEKFARTNNLSFICMKYAPINIYDFSVVSSRNVQISWNSVRGAATYDLYYIRTDKEMDFKKFATTTETTYLDTLTADKTYYYNVVAKDDQGNEISNLSESGYKYDAISTVPIKSIKNTAEGIDLNWQEMDKAAYYKVLWRRDSSNQWNELPSRYEGTYAFDTGGNGSRYYYAVQAFDKNDKAITSYDTTGKEFVCFHTMKINSVKNYGSYTPISWSAVSNAYKYELFYMRTDIHTQWKKFAETKSTTYEDSGHKSGKTYKYCVRAVDKSGTCISVLPQDGTELFYLSSPKFSVNYYNEKGKVKLSWSKVTGANKYAVYYKRSDLDMGWKKINVTTGTSYLDSGCKDGKTYIYAVQCIDDAEVHTTSHYDTHSLTYHMMSYVYSVKKIGGDSSGKVCITWTAVEGAYRYRVFYKRTNPDGSTSSYKQIDNTRWTSCADTHLKGGYTYTYTVIAYDYYDDEICPAYDSTGKSIYYRNADQGYSYPYLVDSYHVDEDYTSFEIHLSDYDRYYAERILMGEAGNMSWSGMCLVAQSLRDAYVEGGYSSIYDTITSMGYVAPLYKEPNSDVEECIHYIFDEGGAAAEHRVLVFYATDCCYSGWHETQCFIYQVGSVRFFDMWDW